MWKLLLAILIMEVAMTVPLVTRALLRPNLPTLTDPRWALSGNREARRRAAKLARAA